MWKRIGLIVISLLVGCGLGVVLTMIYAGHTLAAGMFLLQDREMCSMGAAAENAYYNEPNEVAVWAMSNYIKTLSRIKEERMSAEVENHYFVLSPVTDLVYAHMRLGNLYKKMGNTEKSRYHFEQAISLSKITLNAEEDCLKVEGLNTQEDCLERIALIDKKCGKDLE